MARPCLIIGHRGARGLFPENTMAGFAGALALGVDALELDVALTLDGIVVVSHDPALNPCITRDATGQWLDRPGPLIHTVRADQLATFDVGRLHPGTDYAARFPDQSPADGERIPALEHVLRFHDDADFVIELKTFPNRLGVSADAIELAEAVVVVVDTFSAISHVTVESFDWRGPHHLHRIRPDVRLGWLTCAETVRDAAIWWDGPHPSDFGGSVPRAVAAEGGPVWGPDYADLTLDLVSEAHELGLSVIPWTVNAVGDMARLIEWGVDGIVTDRPERMRCVLTGRCSD